MSAAPQSIPREGPVLDKYGRDPKSAPELERHKKGWSKLPHAWFADLPRLINGPAQMFFLLLIHRETKGKERRSIEPAPEFSEPLTNDWLAQMIQCTVRAVDYVIEDAIKRKLVQAKKAGRGKGFQFKLLSEKWQSLPNYEPEKRPPQLAKEAEPPVAEFQAAEPVRLVDRPILLQRGKQVKPIPVDHPVLAVQCYTDWADCAVDFTVHRGLLLCKIQEPNSGRRIQGEESTESIGSGEVSETGFGNEPPNGSEDKAKARPKPPGSPPRAVPSPHQKLTRPAVNLDNFPESVSFINHRFPATQTSLIVELFGSCVEEFTRVGLSGELVTDATILIALTETPGVTIQDQRSAMLYLKKRDGSPGTLVQCFRTWAREYKATGKVARQEHMTPQDRRIIRNLERMHGKR